VTEKIDRIAVFDGLDGVLKDLDPSTGRQETSSRPSSCGVNPHNHETMRPPR